MTDDYQKTDNQKTDNQKTDNQKAAAATPLKDKLPSTGKGVAAAAGVVAAIAGLITVRAVRKRSGTGDAVDTIFHLKQDDETWSLVMEGSEAPEATFQTKEEGLAAARELARASSPCELIIYRTDGSEQDRHHYGE